MARKRGRGWLALGARVSALHAAVTCSPVQPHAVSWLLPFPFCRTTASFSSTPGNLTTTRMRLETAVTTARTCTTPRRSTRTTTARGTRAPWTLMETVSPALCPGRGFTASRVGVLLWAWCKLAASTGWREVQRRLRCTRRSPTSLARPFLRPVGDVSSLGSSLPKMAGVASSFL